MTRRRLFGLSLAAWATPLLALLPGRRAETSLDQQVLATEPEFNCIEGWDNSGHWLTVGDPVYLTAVGAVEAWRPGDPIAPIGYCDQAPAPSDSYVVIRREPWPFSPAA